MDCNREESYSDSRIHTECQCVRLGTNWQPTPGQLADRGTRVNPTATAEFPPPPNRKPCNEKNTNSKNDQPSECLPLTLLKVRESRRSVLWLPPLSISSETSNG